MALVPEVINTLSPEQISQMVEKLMFWEGDMPSSSSLKQEVSRWQRFWQSQSKVASNLIESLQDADEDFFPNIRQLLLIGCTSPIGSCEAERSFSAVRRIKTFLRSIMGEERLSGLTLMNVHYTEALQLDCSEVVQSFIQKQPRKLFCNSVIFE
jgi:hypothetical protein